MIANMKTLTGNYTIGIRLQMQEMFVRQGGMFLPMMIGAL